MNNLENDQLNSEQNISLDELESLLIKGEQKRKEKIAVQKKAYRDAHKEEIRARNKAYKEAHKDEIAIKRKIYKEKHKKQIKVYNEAHKDEMKTYNKAYYEEHKEEIAAYQKIYYEQKAKELGFENHAQRQCYDRWCRKNNIQVSLKNPEYLEKIQYWINNIDNLRS